MSDNISEDAAENAEITEAEKLDQLFDEAQMIKVSGLSGYFELAGQGETTWAEALKVSQLAVKAMEIQLKIISMRSKKDPGEAAPEETQALERVWNAMLEVPALRALLMRDSVRQSIADALKKSREKQ